MDYSQGKIYKITADDMTYYGSTIMTLQQRFNHHKYNNGINICTSKSIIDTGKAIIELVENFSCQSKNELHIRERYWIENNECVNKVLPIQTQEERKEYEKQYRDEHRDKNLKYFNEYYKNNHDEQLTKSKQNYYKNRDREIARMKTKITCECGTITNKTHVNRHKQSKKHQAWILKSNHNIECMS